MTQRTALWALLFVLAKGSLVLAQAAPTPTEPGAQPEQPPQTQPGAPEEAPPTDETAPTAAPETAPELEAQPPPEPAPTEAPAVSGEIDTEAAFGTDEAAATPPAEQAPADSGEMIVTGTRIKRTAFVASAPVEVIDRKQLEYSGATNLADVVQYLTVAQGGGFQGGITPGTVQVNLRGLGAGATLVLLNGRRMPPSGGGVAEHFTDISTIPLAAVERVEILKGGASAIYGSDAVAGVVNIITRKNFDGVRFEVDGQTTEEFDQQDGTLSGAIGATSERGRVLAGINYFRRTELTGGERDFTKDGQHYSRQGFPSTFINPANGATMPDPGCADAPGADPFMESATSTICRFDFRTLRSLMGKAERISGFASADYDLTNHTTLFTELNVSRLRGDGLSSTFAVAPPLPVVPANHVDNPFGTNLLILGRPFGFEDPPRNTADDDSVRVVVGLKGDLEGAAEDTMFEDWEWEVYASFGVSRYRNIINDNLADNLQGALNSCSDPSHLEGCFNPFYSAIDGTGTPNSDAVINSIKGQMEVLNDHALQTYNAGMAGSLFELPGGDVGLAFGGEIRHESRSSELDHDANELRYGFVVGNSDAIADRDVYSGYLELRWPFFDGIEVQTAGRAERYTDIDETAISPTVGLTLTPSEIAGRENTPSALRRLQLRGHVARAFRAPTIFQSFPGFAIVPTLFQLQSSPVPVFVPVQAFGNPDLDNETAIALSGGLVWSPIDEIGLSADFWYYDYEDRIAPESAQQKVDQWEADPDNPPPGIILVEDPLTGAQQLSRVQIKNINTQGHTLTNGIDFGVMFNLTGATFGGSKEDWGTISFGAQGTYTLTFKVPRILLSDAAIEGGAYECDGPDPDDSCDVLGHRNAPNTAFPPYVAQWRLNFPLTYGYNGHSASVIGHWMSSLDDNVDTGRAGDFTEEIDAFFTLDAMYGYTLKDVVGEELTVRVGVFNVLDQDPPLVFTALDGFEPEAHDPRGRMFYAKLISVF